MCNILVKHDAIEGPALLNLAPGYLHYVGIPFDVDGLHSGVIFDSAHCVKHEFTHEIEQQGGFDEGQHRGFMFKHAVMPCVWEVFQDA